MASNSAFSCTIIVILVFCDWATVNAQKDTTVSYAITCDPKTQPNCRSKTLGTILNGVEGEYDVHVNLNTTQIQLNEVINKK